MSEPLTMFKTKQWDGFGGTFIDSDTLSAAWGTSKPHVFEGMVEKMFIASDLYAGKPLLGATLGRNKVTYIDNEEYRWYLRGIQDKTAKIVEFMETGNTAIGIGNSLFRIKSDLDYFVTSDVIMFEDPEYFAEIIEGPIQDGIGYIYVCRLQTENPAKFIPSEFLQPGKEFDKVWNTISSEANSEFSGTRYPSSMQLQSQLGYFSQKLTMTDKAMRQAKKISFHGSYTDPKTGKEKEFKKIMADQEARMHDELYCSMEAQMTYGVRTTYDSNRSRYWKKTGPGLRQYLREGHIHRYSGELTESLITQFLMDVFFHRVPLNQRKVTFMTGEMGMIAFHNALINSARQWTTVDSHFIQQVKDGKAGNHLSYGAQFTHYKGPNGIEVSLVHNPMYDDMKYCKRTHPDYPNRPIDSWRMTVLDFGTSEYQSKGNTMRTDNIQVVKEKDSYSYGYVPGTVGPTGPIQGGMGGGLIAETSWWVQGSAGLWMVDPTRGGELILDFE